MTPLYELYFATLRSPSMYMEHRFLNMFQALESYDRRTRVISEENRQAHQGRVSRILNSVKGVKGKDRSFLKDRLKGPSEPTAKDRINYLVQRMEADWLLKPEEVELAADFRNFLTHFDPTVEMRLARVDERSHSISDLAVRLQILCEIIFLTTLGFSSGWIRDRIEKTRRLERRGACMR